MQEVTRFEFGKNWQSFARRALNEGRVEQARLAFSQLLPAQKLRGAKFLDVGFGQGLSLLLAAEAGAIAQGIDIDADNLAAFQFSAQKLSVDVLPHVQVGSILDTQVIAALSCDGLFDVVHAWGVLHHTGRMWAAVENCISLVRPSAGGLLVISIYNRHWSSAAWGLIKWTYNVLPRFGQKILTGLMYPVILVAKFIVTGKNPFQKERGMDFYHDVVDWVGGYPYEYAAVDEVKNFVEARGFKLLKVLTAQVPTGCNEFVFERIGVTV